MKTTTETKDWLLGEIVGYADEHKRKPIWEMTKEVKVKIINWKPIIDKINETLSKTDPSISVEIRCGNGVIFVGEDKAPILLDNECCGVKSESKNLFINGGIVTMQVIKGVGVFKKLEGGIAMYPTWYVDFDYDEIQDCFTGEEKELWDFMGSRYEYNPRISSNLRSMVSLYKGIDKKKK